MSHGKVPAELGALAMWTACVLLMGVGLGTMIEWAWQMGRSFCK